MEYLLEVRSDELPSRFLRRALEELSGGLVTELASRGLEPLDVERGLSQRRLAICLRELPERQEDREERELGPSAEEAWDEAGEPTPALLGFAERMGADPAELRRVATERGDYVARVVHHPGRHIAEVLAQIVPEVLARIRWPASALGWSADGTDWIRPLRSLVSLLDGEVVPIELAGLAAGRSTAGHPVLSPESFEVAGWDDYRAKLAERGLEISFEARRETLRSALEEQAIERGGRPRAPAALLDRLALRCEIPGVVVGRFDGDFLALPPELVQATLEHRQSAVTLSDGEELLAYFFAGMDRADDPEGCVRAGQERAAAGHLSDARFHWQRDRRTALAERARWLDQLVFHPRLGDYGAKSRRVKALVVFLAGELGHGEAVVTAVSAAAELLKADRTTSLVRDLSPLRGRLGGIIAREEGYPPAVWQAIYDQYLPVGLDDPLPRHLEGRLIAIADRIDTLVGCFGLGEVPSGSRDRHGLRRRASGLLRILIEGELPVDLDLVVARAVLLHGENGAGLDGEAEAIVDGVRSFLLARLRHLFSQRGFASDEVEAAMAVGTRHLPELAARIAALQAVREEPGFRSLVLAAKRISNIIREAPEHELRAERLEEDAEKDLYSVLVDVRRDVDEAVAEKDWRRSLLAMAGLVPALDRFFAEVLVMDENETRRDNRMALLQAVRRVFWKTARLKEMDAGEVGE